MQGPCQGSRCSPAVSTHDLGLEEGRELEGDVVMLELCTHTCTKTCPDTCVHAWTHACTWGGGRDAPSSPACTGGSAGPSMAGSAAHPQLHRACSPPAPPGWDMPGSLSKTHSLPRNTQDGHWVSGRHHAALQNNLNSAPTEVFGLS